MLRHKGNDKLHLPSKNLSTVESNSKLLPLMRAMEQARSEWQPKFEATGVFDQVAVNRMTELRIELLLESASTKLDLMIQCATLEMVAELMMELMKSAELPNWQAPLARDTASELVVGLRNMQTALEAAAGITANDLGLFNETGRMN